LVIRSLSRRRIRIDLVPLVVEKLVLCFYVVDLGMLLRAEPPVVASRLQKSG
jgi:hypothetical protein